MRFDIRFTDVGLADLSALERDAGLAKRLKAVRKALAILETNLRHPGLNTHEFDDRVGPDNEKIYEAYAENNTPAAYRIFFCYPSNKTRAAIRDLPDGAPCLLVVAITAHP